MWVLAVLASLAVLITLVLCVPLDLAFHVDVYGRPKFSLRLVWLFGLISPELGKGKKKPEEKKRVVEGKRKPPDRRRRAKAVKVIFEILRIKGLLRQLIKLLRDVIGSFRIRELGANFRVGFDNPADTGLIFAVIGPATHFLGSSRFHGVRIEPSFDEAVCEGYLQGAVGLQPVRLIVPFLRFAFSSASLRIVKILILSKWKSRK